MFGIFKKKNKLDELQENYKNLSKQSFMPSISNKNESGKKHAETKRILEQIEILQQY